MDEKFKDEYYLLLGKRIKKCRLRLGLNQRQFSRQLNIPQSYLSNFETGARPVYVHIIYKMNITYGISPAWLILGKGPQWIGAGNATAIDRDMEEIKRLFSELSRVMGLEQEDGPDGPDATGPTRVDGGNHVQDIDNQDDKDGG